MLQQKLICLVNGGIVGNSKFIIQNATSLMINPSIAENNCK